MDPIEASCNCGAVTVRATAPALMQFYCHCDDCQRATGAPYIGVAVFPAGAVSVHGETDAWTLRTLPRHRCRACGTQMIGEVPGGELVGIRADRLPADAFQPRFHINCRYAQLPVRDALPHYAGVPPELGGDDDARVAGEGGAAGPGVAAEAPAPRPRSALVIAWPHRSAFVAVSGVSSHSACRSLRPHRTLRSLRAQHCRPRCEAPRP